MNEHGLWTSGLFPWSRKEQGRNVKLSETFRIQEQKCLSVSNRLEQSGSEASSSCINGLKFPYRLNRRPCSEHKMFWMAVPLRKKNVQMVKPFILGWKYKIFLVKTLSL